MRVVFLDAYVQLRAIGVALAASGGSTAALSGNDATVFKTLPETFQAKLVETFKTSGSFPAKAASFPILECLATMVGMGHKIIMQ